MRKTVAGELGADLVPGRHGTRFTTQRQERRSTSRPPYRMRPTWTNGPTCSTQTPTASARATTLAAPNSVLLQHNTEPTTAATPLRISAGSAITEGDDAGLTITANPAPGPAPAVWAESAPEQPGRAAAWTQRPTPGPHRSPGELVAALADAVHVAAIRVGRIETLRGKGPGNEGHGPHRCSVRRAAAGRASAVVGGLADFTAPMVPDGLPCRRSVPTLRARAWATTPRMSVGSVELGAVGLVLVGVDRCGVGARDLACHDLAVGGVAGPVDPDLGIPHA